MKPVNSRQYIVNRRVKFVLFAFSLITIYYLLSTPLLAQDSTEYKLLEPLPTVKADAEGKVLAKDYIPGIVQLVIIIAGVLAVIKIIFGGIKYMSTDAIGGKSEGKEHIQNALWGLLLVISSWVILNTLNPKLLKFDLKIEGLEVGKRFNTGLGQVQVIDTNTRDRAKTEMGCQNCVPIIYGAMGSSAGEKLVSTKPYSQSGVPFPSKPPGGGCANTYGICFVHASLAEKLINMANDLQSKGIHFWQVTEMLPPTTPDHISKCHKLNNERTGQCVDASIRSNYYHSRGQYSGCADPRYLLIFLTSIADNIGPSFQWEVPSGESKCLNYYKDNLPARLQGKIKPGGTGQHAHINLTPPPVGE